MSLKPRLVPVRILKFWFDLVLVVAGAGCGLMVLWLLVSPVLMAGSDKPTDAAVRVVVGERAWWPVYPLEARPHDGVADLGIQQPRLVKAQGELRFLTTTWWLHFVSMAEELVFSLVALYVVWILRKLLINVLAEEPFSPANARYLRRSAVIILTVSVLWPPLDYLLARMILGRIDITNLEIYPAFNFSKDVILVGLLFLVFSAILSRGQDLEEEQKLTV